MYTPPANVVTPQTRAIITRALNRRGKWSGSRRGVSLAFTLDKPGPAARVHYWANVAGQVIDGRAETVFDAAAEITNRITSRISHQGEKQK